MNINVNFSLSMVYDFLQVIVAKYNGLSPYKTDSTISNSSEEAAEACIETVWKGLNINVQGMSLFFKTDTTGKCYISEFYGKRLPEFPTISTIISDLLDQPSETLVQSLLTYYSGNTNISTDSKNLFDTIESLDLAHIQKWELLALTNNSDAYLEPLCDLLNQVRRHIQRLYKDNEATIKKFNKLMSIRVRNDTAQLMNNELDYILSRRRVNTNKEIIIAGSFIKESSIDYIENDAYLVFFLGSGYTKALPSLKLMSESHKYEVFLKAFSDKNRLKIIRLLTGRTMYVGQIAKTCGLVISTTSYHLDILLSAGILNSKTQSKRVFYTVNKDVVLEYFQNIHSLFERDLF